MKANSKIIDSHVQFQYKPSVLQGVRQGYWCQEVGLILHYAQFLNKIGLLNQLFNLHILITMFK